MKREKREAKSEKNPFFILVFVFFLLAAGAQTYTVTEIQLQKLETIYQRYKANNATLQEQLNESKQQALALQKTAEKLRSEAETLQNESTTLKIQLESERNSTKSLSESLTRYEISEAAKNQEILELNQELALREYKMNKYKTAAVTLTAAVVILLLALAAFIYASIRKPGIRTATV